MSSTNGYYLTIAREIFTEQSGKNDAKVIVPVLSDAAPTRERSSFACVHERNSRGSLGTCDRSQVHAFNLMKQTMFNGKT